MTRHLNSLAEMAIALVELEAAEYLALETGLARILALIEKRAKAEFGHYQPEAGAFGAWPELAEATKDDRAQQGYPEDEPLLRSGELRDSISHEQQGLEGVVGSTSEVMVYHEFGTEKMPARPVLGPAAFRSRPAIEKLAAAAVVAGLIGADAARGLAGGDIHEALGYSFESEGS